MKSSIEMVFNTDFSIRLKLVNRYKVLAGRTVYLYTCTLAVIIGRDEEFKYT